MGKVRARTDTKKLYLDFSYRNIRFREQTALLDNKTNRRKREQLMERIDAEITLGQFDYARYFPNSKNLKKLNRAIAGQPLLNKQAPKFEGFAELWFDECKIAWRASYTKTVNSILFGRLVEHFGNKAVDQIRREDILAFRASLAKVQHGQAKPLSNTHINRHIKILRMVLEEAACNTPIFNSRYKWRVLSDL